MGTESGDATADLLALLEEKCPDVASETRARLGSAAGAEAGAGAGAPAPLAWRRWTLGDLPGVSEFAGAVSAPVSVIAAVLSFIAGILDVISAFLLGFPDPFRALILAAYNLLKSIVDDFLNSGCHLYFDAPGVTSTWVSLSDMGLVAEPPPQWRAGDERAPLGEHLVGQLATTSQPAPGATADGFERWAFRFAQSFDDPGDEDRPIFSDGAPVEALFIVATAPQLVSLRPLLELLGKLLDIGAFEKAWEKFRQDSPDPDRSRVRMTRTAPDWYSFKLRDIAPPGYPLRKLEKVPELLKSLLLNVDDVIQLLKDLIQAIRDKIELLQELIAIIQSIIDLIRALTATGFHALAVATDAGVDGLRRAFIEAENRPNTDPSGNTETAHAVAGVCLLAGTTNVLPVWALLGQGASFEQASSGLHGDWKELRDTAEQALDDTRALATEAFEGTGAGGGAPQDEGIRGLWEGLGDRYEEQRDAVLRGLGLSEPEADERARSDRNQLIAGLEAALRNGTALDPQVLAHIEATRRARRRGRRSLAMALGARRGAPPGSGA